MKVVFCNMINMFGMILVIRGDEVKRLVFRYLGIVLVGGDW